MLSNVELWKRLSNHYGHKVVIAKYGDVNNPVDICLECEDCNEVILSADTETIQARDDI